MNKAVQGAAMRRRIVSVIVAAAVVGALLQTVPAGTAVASTRAKGPAVQRTVPVHGHPLAVRKPPPDAAAAAARHHSGRPVWPSPGNAVVPLSGPGASAAIGPSGRRAGTLPIWVVPASGEPPQPAGDPGSAITGGHLRLSVLGRDAAEAAGVHGLLLTAGSVGRPSRVGLKVGYGPFAQAFGGDWASRLRIVLLPACALTKPAVPSCQTQTPVATRNDRSARTVTADIDAPAVTAASTPGAADSAAGSQADPAVLAVTAGASGSTGSFAATSLAPSAAWQVADHTGDFTWSYPLAVPPAVGGPTPELGIQYSSGSIDGRVASTNNQPSWIGEGHSLEPGFVEQVHRLR